VPSPAVEEPAAKAEPPKLSPQETITNFLNRFRPQARSTKPAVLPPSSVPSVSLPPALSSDIQEQAKPAGSKALTEIQGKVTEKAAELK
jgi:hypothetical protein